MLRFEPTIRKILALIAKDRQTVMFSATWPPEVVQLSVDFISNPMRVHIGSDELVASESISQIIDIINEDDKPRRLLSTITTYKDQRILIFASTKARVDNIVNSLIDSGYTATAIHGDKSQDER